MQNDAIMPPMLEFQTLHRRADDFHVFLFSKDAKGEDEHRIRLIDADHAVVAALINKNDKVAKLSHIHSSLASSSTFGTDTALSGTPFDIAGFPFGVKHLAP